MPKNRFPDSIEKRELRRIDARQLRKFRERMQLSGGLTYCGMPSVEFLDVVEWSAELKHVEAIEYDKDTYDDMLIQWPNVRVAATFTGHQANIYDYLKSATQTFDLYNLDFYSGFLNTKGTGGSNATESLRELIARHANKAHSFVLIATFNVRQTGIKAYDTMIDELPNALSGYKNVAKSCEEHKRKSQYRTKIGYPYFCWFVGRAHGFSVRFSDIYYYKSSVPLLHFYSEFLYSAHALPTLPSGEALAELANKPLKQLRGMVPSIAFRPPIIELPP